MRNFAFSDCRCDRVGRRTYSLFSGADFSSAPGEVSLSRSPDMCNMIPENGLLVKRPGWRVLGRLSAAPTAMTSAYLGGMKYFLAVAGGYLYVWGGSLELPASDAQIVAAGLTGCRRIFIAEADLPPATGRPSGPTVCAFACGGGKFVCFDASVSGVSYRSARPVAQIGYAPVTAAGRSPDGTAGTVLESVNAASPRRRNRFTADGTSVRYQLDAVPDTTAGVTASYIGGAALTVSQVDAAARTVIFAAAPAASADGADNVEIAFTAADAPAEPAKCVNAATFTIGHNDTRIVLSGHPDKPNYEWMSAPNDPTYFPDDGYAVVGGGESAVMGYLNIDGAQCIVTDARNGAPTLYLRGHVVDADGKAVVTIRQGASGPPPVSADAFLRIGTEALYLSEEGMMAVTASDTRDSAAALRPRSYFADGRLLPLLKEEWPLRATSYDGRGIVFVGNKVFVFDQKLGGTPDGGRAYECFLWDGIPSNGAVPYGDPSGLYFITAAGKVCRFNDDVEGFGRYLDGDDGDAVNAWWSTVADDDGALMNLKKLENAGSGVTLSNKFCSRVVVTLTTETGEQTGRVIETGRFEWSPFSFRRMPFRSAHADVTVPFGGLSSRYRLLTIRVSNDRPDQGFGLYAITKRYSIRKTDKEGIN
ncbi:MAG: hypothetical protein KIG36_02885 [Eubacteriales bacterium]|nr:hypothetical protein [Eubacteriales bacterium]